MWSLSPGIQRHILVWVGYYGGFGIQLSAAARNRKRWHINTSQRRSRHLEPEVELRSVAITFLLHVEHQLIAAPPEDAIALVPDRARTSVYIGLASENTISEGVVEV